MTRDEIKAIYLLGPQAVIDLVEGLYIIIQQQQLQIDALTARVKELEDRLATNSRNSSKPPSSDSFNKKKRSLRPTSGKKPGGQPGHPGSSLKQVETPDLIVNHTPTSCSNCAATLETVAGTFSSDRRQVFDIPPIKMRVVEHRSLVKECPDCGHKNSGEFPSSVLPGAQYGSGVKGLAVYLNKQHLVPSERTCQILEDLLGQRVSQGVLQGGVEECAAKLANVEEKIIKAIRESDRAHFDETGFYVNGKRQWLQVASTETLTYYFHHSKRGSEATKEMGILEEFSGRATHDGFSAYMKYSCDHALCNAHHLRELIFIQEQMGEEWAGKMKRLLLEIKAEVEQAKERGEGRLEDLKIEEYEKSYEAILKEGLEVDEKKPPLPTGKRGRKKQSKAKNLIDRLWRYRKETLAFMYDFRVSFDNNLAERDLRMMKVQQKISGCFRTDEGAGDFCRIRSYISTMRKQGHNILVALKTVFSGIPLAPDTPG